MFDIKMSPFGTKNQNLGQRFKVRGQTEALDSYSHKTFLQFYMVNKLSSKIPVLGFTNTL